MKKKGLFLLLMVVFLLATESIQAQCSICTKTASQLGEGPAKALNSAIIYLAFAPLPSWALLVSVGGKKSKPLLRRKKPTTTSTNHH